MSNDTQPDNPPAFPRTYSCDASGNRQHVQDSCAYIETKGGMTLRDWFAGQALTGILLAPGQLGADAQSSPNKAAYWAYGQADAMLRAREAKP